MKVTMVFEFPEMTDLNSHEATELVDALTAISVQQQAELNALPPYKGLGKVAVWIDEVEE